MTLKRMTPALLAASVFLTGATGILLGAVTPAHAITSVDELSDVNQEHWAFEALQDLVEKYDVIEGYPDGTFRGNRFPTRWEMAAALNALIKTVGRDLARLGAEKADKRDLQTLARLQEEFRNELNAINARVKSLEDRANSIEAKNDEQDVRLGLLEKTQIHGDFSMGFLSDISSQGVHVSGRNNNDGIADGMSAIGRLRLALDIPIREEKEDSKIGRGDLYTRLIAATGRIAPSGGLGNNTGPTAAFSGYSRIAGDADQYNDGLFTSNTQHNSSGSNVRGNLYVEAAYYKQNLKSGIPVLTDWMGVFPEKDGWETTADAYFGLIPWRFLFDKSPYRGNEMTQFQNTSLINTPGIAVNQNVPMIAYQMHQGLGQSANVDLTAGLGSMSAADAMEGLNITYEARLNYITDFLGSELAKPGSLYAGGYHIFMSGNTLGTVLGANRSGLLSAAAGSGSPVGRSITENDTTNSFYVGWNQEWFRGIGSFVNYMMSSSGSGNFAGNSNNQTLGANVAFNTAVPGAAVGTVVGVRQALSTGLQIPISALAPGLRDNDVIGLGYALVDLHEQGISETGRSSSSGTRDTIRIASSFEHVMEAYYKYQATESISVVPSVQFIFNRLGLSANDFTTVLGVRTNFLF